MAQADRRHVRRHRLGARGQLAAVVTQEDGGVRSGRRGTVSARMDAGVDVHRIA